MVNVARPPGEVTVDSRGRVFGLQRIRSEEHRAFTRYLASEDEDGVITLTPVVSVPATELRAGQQQSG